MKFSYSAIWADVIALIGRHGTLVGAIAGVFLFLPALLLGYFAPPPPVEEGTDMIAAITAHYRANAHWFLLVNFVGMIGTLGIMHLVFRPNVTVGGAIAAGAAMFPFYFIASFLGSIAIGFGLLLLLVPGIYLFGRLAPLAPVMVAETLRNPIEALPRTWAVTRGKGWAVVGIFLLVGFAGAVLVSVATTILGIILTLALPREIADFLNLLIATSASAALQVVLILLYAAVYRALTAAGGQAEGVPGETSGS